MPKPRGSKSVTVQRFRYEIARLLETYGTSLVNTPEYVVVAAGRADYADDRLFVGLPFALHVVDLRGVRDQRWVFRTRFQDHGVPYAPRGFGPAGPTPTPSHGPVILIVDQFRSSMPDWFRGCPAYKLRAFE